MEEVDVLTNNPNSNNASDKVTSDKVIIVSRESIDSNRLNLALSRPAPGILNPPNVDTRVVSPEPEPIRLKENNKGITSHSCSGDFKPGDATITLQTTSRLKLRKAPSLDADTIRILKPNVKISARRITCGNWTEIIQNELSQGFVFSYFLTTPDD